MKYSDVNIHQNYNLLILYIRLSYSDSLEDSPVNVIEDRQASLLTYKQKEANFMDMVQYLCVV